MIFNHYKEIYPPELVLNKENPTHNKTATFLDLNININRNKFEYELYDKRNAFGFNIVRFPYKSSNMPLRMFYSTIGAEFLRICRASSQYKPFIDACQPFVARMRNQGADNDKMFQCINKMINNHKDDFGKFNVIQLARKLIAL